jgi:hypothetical protein
MIGCESSSRPDREVVRVIKNEKRDISRKGGLPMARAA